MKKNGNQILNILIIEDDKYTRLEIKDILNPFGLIKEAKNIPDGFKALKEEHFDLVLTDIELEDRSGIEIIPEITKTGTPCIVVSSFEGEDVIEKAYALGVKHFLSKMKLRELLPIYIQKCIQDKSAFYDDLIKESFVTQHPRFHEDLKELCSTNLKNKSLFISGNTGTGKSLLGKLIHQITNPQSNLIHINCSELSESLLESELFGHEKGAFTGADQKKDGKLKLANGGTLFLDEIATMSLSMQQKLLKALDEKTFYPVGADKPVTSDFTLISATCEDLLDKLKKKEFREDLYFRITGYHFHLPNLSERKEDIEHLIKYFQLKQNRRFTIKTDALEFLKNYSWPGNIRELKKICEKMSENKTGIIDNEFIKKNFQKNETLLPRNHDYIEEIQRLGLKEYINKIELTAITESLKRNNFKITKCIKELQISSSAFYRIIKENKIEI